MSAAAEPSLRTPWQKKYIFKKKDKRNNNGRKLGVQ